MRKLSQNISQTKAQAASQMREAVLPLLLDEKAAAAYCGVSLSYLRKGRCEGTVGDRTPAPRFVKIGKRVLYKASELELWVAALEARSTI